MDNNRPAGKLIKPEQALDKRTIKRHQLPYYLEVYNRITKKPLGYIVNISSQGMMLVSNSQTLTHAVFNMYMMLPEPINGHKRIDFDALSQWCKPDVTPGYYDTGFSFTRVPSELQQLVEALKDYFSFKALES